jgi:hypothetical protein
MADNHRLALNTLSGLTPETEVNLWFEKNQSTRFFLRLDVSDVDAQVLLTDLKTGQSVNLTQDKSYPFTSDAADSPDRFRLHFSHVGTPEMKSSQEIRIFSDTRGIVIRNRQGQIFDGEVFVYNMLGQLAFQSELNGSSIYSLPPINSGSSHRYFIVKLMTGNHILTGKIFNTLYTN